VIATAAQLIVPTVLLAALAAAQQPPAFEVTAIDGKVTVGTVTATADGVRVAPRTGEPTSRPLDQLLAIRRTDPPRAPTAPAPLQVWLRSGGVLPAVAVDGVAPAAGGAARWLVDTAGGARLELAQTAIAALRCREPAPETFAADLRAPETNSDFLYVVKDGQPQRFRVAVARIEAGRVHFDLGGQSYDFPLTGADSVAAIVFGKNTGFAPDRQAKPRVAVKLASGENCEGRLESIDATLAMQLDEGARLVVPIDRVLAIDVATERLVWLSTLEPRVEQTAAFDRKWPWTVDCSPAGPGIRLGGKAYTHGIVVVPRTRLTFDLGGRYDLFEATIGIEERGGPQAHAIFRVFGDGKLLFESTPFVLGTAPLALHLPLDRCHEIAIEADFGKNFDLGDLCAFADARVVQQ
jgi:hypothetical protein